jgi:putative endonuclease
MLASQRNGTLYIGVTSNLIGRVYQHRNEMTDSFTKRYGIHDLVGNEIHEMMENAILREKQLKKWSRIAKIRLLEQRNPNRQDLWSELASPSMASGFMPGCPARHPSGGCKSAPGGFVRQSMPE